MSELDDYQYELPRELIAQRPLAQRSDARLLVVDRSSQAIEHQYVRDLPELLDQGDCLAINDSRVVPARLVGRRTQTDGKWEGLFLAADGQGLWKILGKTRGKISAGESVTLMDQQGNDDVELRLVQRLEDGQWLVRVMTDDDTWDVLDRIGRVPLPYYIRSGNMLDEDRDRYQTIFAKNRGSVAAPTAGLHFNEPLLDALRQNGIGVVNLTLHVGLDTFRPITAKSLNEHVMHTEIGGIEQAAAQRLRNCRERGNRVVAVGTTSVRVLESAAADGELRAWAGSTDLFIRPPYQFRAMDALMTNFHLPRTTLLVLVRCFGGDELMQRAYQEAIQEEYRFYSYGDAMLIL